MRSWWPWWARGATSTGTAARPRTQPSPQLDQAAAGDLSFPSGKWRTSALLVDVVAVLRPGRRRQLGLMRVTVEDGDAVSVEDLGVLVDVLAIPVRQPGVFSIGARSPPPRGWSRGAVKGLAQARAGGPGRPGGRGREPNPKQGGAHYLRRDLGGCSGTDGAGSDDWISATAGMARGAAAHNGRKEPREAAAVRLACQPARPALNHLLRARPAPRSGESGLPDHHEPF